jgi:hypothetical protein
VPWVAAADSRLSAALDAGYGLTESQKSEGSHHRLLGTFGVGLVPLQGLELGLLGGLRHDRHPADRIGTDQGTIGELSLMARYGVRLDRAWRLGADLGANFPGSERPLRSLSSPAIDARALLGWVADDGIHIAGFAGFRLDRTSSVGADASRYRFGDRLALGLSDFNAVLVGVGAVVPMGRSEMLGEITGDLLVGSGAPPLSKSPIRIALGLRHALSNALQAELLAEFSPSRRPDISPNSALIPIEPRVGVLLGLRYRLWNGARLADAQRSPAPPRSADAAPLPKTPVPPVTSVQEPTAVAPPSGRILVTVLDYAGRPLSDAVVELATDAGIRKLEFQSGATFALDAAPLGRARLTVRAELMREWAEDVELLADRPLEVKVEMVAGENAGQIRGVIRGFDGKSLPAHVRIEPGGREIRATIDGSFSVDVAPGEYRVKVWLEGYQPQQRRVEVGKNGVLVLNVDLQKGR